MKTQRKFTPVWAVFIVLGLVSSAVAVIYNVYTPITNVSITSHNDNDTVYVGQSYTLTCSTSTDSDSYCDAQGWHYPTDSVTHTWTGSGTFTPQTGTSVTWTPPDSTGSITITVTADDSPLANDTAKTDSVTLTVDHVLVAAGDKHSLVIKDVGELWACGSNKYGLLGINTTEGNEDTIVQVHDGEQNTTSGYLENIIFAAGGNWHTLAVDSNGNVWASGGNSKGQLGNGSTNNSSVPVKVQDGLQNTSSGYLENIVKVAAGSGLSLISMALEGNGDLWAWGDGMNGLLGIGLVDNPPVLPGTYVAPAKVINISNVVDMDAGENHSIAVDSSGNVFCWGRNKQGQIGNGTTYYTGPAFYPAPNQVHNSDDTGYLENIIEVEASLYSSYALEETTGHVWAWGSNFYGQLGDGTTNDSNLPVKVKDGEQNNPSGYLENIVSIAAGNSYVLTLDEDGYLWAWGVDNHGQLGCYDCDCNCYPAMDHQTTPVQVVKDTNGTPLSDIVYIAAGNGHSLAVDKNGDVWVWGHNSSDQLGLGPDADLSYYYAQKW